MGVLLFDSAAFNLEYAVILYLYLITRVELSATPFFFLPIHLYVPFLQQRFGHAACGYTIRQFQKLVQLDISTVDNYFFIFFVLSTTYPQAMDRALIGCAVRQNDVQAAALVERSEDNRTHHAGEGNHELLTLHNLQHI